MCELRLGPFVARILPAGRAFAARLGLPAPAPELPLTDRDRELARLVAGRCTNKEIAAALYLSEGTVKQYVARICDKLQVNSRTQVLVRSIQLGLVNPSQLPPIGG